jgi:hypothetical protein
VVGRIGVVTEPMSHAVPAAGAALVLIAGYALARGARRGAARTY